MSRQKPRPPRELAVADTRRNPPLGFTFTPYNPDDLIGRKGMQIYDQMRVDEQVKACLFLKKCAIIGPGWSIEPKNRRDEGQRLLADRLTEDLVSMPGTFQGKLLEMMTALDYGFSVTEKLWELGGRVKLVDLKVRAPHHIEFEQDAFGNVRGISQQNTRTMATLPPSKFIRLTYRGDFSNPYGQSDLREAHKMWWYKTNWLQWWATFAEKLSDPPLVGLHPTNAGKAAVDQVMRVLEHMQARTALTVPEGWDIKLLETSRDPRAMFQAALDWFNLSIGKALLVPDKLGFAGGEVEGGSFSLSQTQMGAFFFILELLADWLQQAVQELVDEMTMYEVGEAFEPPKFVILPLSQQNKEAISTLWIQATSSGAVLSDFEDENHLRKLIGFPEKDEAERAAMEAMKAQQTAQAQVPGAPPGEPGAETGQPGADLPPEDETQGGPPPFGQRPRPPQLGPAGRVPPVGGGGPKPPQLKVAAAEKYRRPLTAMEQRADMEEKRATFDELTTPLAHALAASAERIVADLKSKAKAGLSEDEVRDLSLKPTTIREVRKTLATAMRGAYARGAAEARAEIGRARTEFAEIQKQRLGPVERSAFRRLWGVAAGVVPARLMAEWREEDHPRDEDGKFTSAGGGGGGSSKASSTRERFRHRTDVKPQLDPPLHLAPVSVSGVFTDTPGLPFRPDGTIPEPKPEGFEQKRYWVNHGFYTEGPKAGEPLPGSTEKAFSKGPAADGLPDYTDNPQRAALHHDITTKYFSHVKSVPEDQQPVAVLTMGIPAAGKSTMLKDIDKSNYVHVDPDEIKALLPEYQQAVNQGTIDGLTVSATDGSQMVQDESVTIGKRMVVMSMAQRKNVIIDGTGRDIERMARTIRDLKLSGYRVQLLMPDVPAEEAIKRASSRAEGSGRHMPQYAIHDSYGKSPFNFEPLSREVDEFRLFDGVRGTPVWSGKDGVETIHDHEYYQKFRRRTRKETA